jgi:hypothetical protein
VRAAVVRDDDYVDWVGAHGRESTGRYLHARPRPSPLLATRPVSSCGTAATVGS